MAQRSEKQAMKRPSSAQKKGTRFKFFSEVIAELKKAVWPTRQETIRLTSMVLFICLALGLLLGILDYGFTKLITVILGG